MDQQSKLAFRKHRRRMSPSSRRQQQTHMLKHLFSPRSTLLLLLLQPHQTTAPFLSHLLTAYAPQPRSTISVIPHLSTFLYLRRQTHMHTHLVLYTPYTVFPNASQRCGQLDRIPVSILLSHTEPFTTHIFSEMILEYRNFSRTFFQTLWLETSKPEFQTAKSD